MRIEQLRHFLEVAKCHSISQAAENLLIGKSTLSNSINSLENELQNQLFFRTTKGTFLTPFGENILSYTNGIIESTEKIYALSHKPAPISEDSLYIYSYPVGCISSIIGLMKYMKNSFPEAKIYVPETQSESVLQDLVSSGHNIGLSSASPLNYAYIKMNAENHDFICEPVFEDSIFVYVNKNHPLSKEKSIDIKDISLEPLAIFRLFLIAEANGFYHDFKILKKRYAVDNYELLKNLVLENEMIAIAPTMAFYNSIYCKNKDIVPIPLTGCSVKLISFLIYKKNISELNFLEKAALDYLRSFYKALK